MKDLSNLLQKKQNRVGGKYLKTCGSSSWDIQSHSIRPSPIKNQVWIYLYEVIVAPNLQKGSEVKQQNEIFKLPYNKCKSVETES